MLNSLLDKFKKKYSGIRLVLVKNILILQLGILKKETVNLNKVKRTLPEILGNPDCSMEAHYKRLLRIFEPDYKGDKFHMELTMWFILTWVLKAQADKGKVWLMDGTSWEFGSRKIHVLVLSVLLNGVAVPIMWLELGKKGHSCFVERKALLRMAKKFYDVRGKILVGDREYIGREWFKYIKSLGMDFIFRLPYGDYRSEINQSKGRRYYYMEKIARRGKQKVSKLVKIDGVQGRLVMLLNLSPENPGDNLIILFSTLDKVRKITDTYRKRWKIEYCFKHLKTNGFNLEQLGFKDPKKIRLLLAIVVGAYVLAIQEGLKDFKSIAIKKYADNTEGLAQSIFTKGLDNLAKITHSFVLFIETCLSYLNKFQKITIRSINTS